MKSSESVAQATADQHPLFRHQQIDPQIRKKWDECPVFWRWHRGCFDLWARARDPKELAAWLSPFIQFAADPISAGVWRAGRFRYLRETVLIFPDQYPSLSDTCPVMTNPATQSASRLEYSDLPSVPDAEIPEQTENREEEEPVILIGLHLRRFRKQRGWSLEQLARQSRVSRAMLGQIELGKSTPTITVLCKIAEAFGVPLTAFLNRDASQEPRIIEAENGRVLISQAGRIRCRALFPPETRRKVEFFELTLAADTIERIEPYPAGTLVNLVVSRGSVSVAVNDGQYPLAAGDAIVFAGDSPHTLHTPADSDACLYLVRTYPDVVS